MKDNKEQLTKYFVDNLRLSNTINKIKKNESKQFDMVTSRFARGDTIFH